MTNISQALQQELSQTDTLLEVLDDHDVTMTPQQREEVDALDHYTELTELEWLTDEYSSNQINAFIEETEQRIQEAVLSVDTTLTKTVWFGCGGPSRYFEIDFEGGEPVRGRYIDTSFRGHEKDSRVEIPLSSDEMEIVVSRYYLDGEV